MMLDSEAGIIVNSIQVYNDKKVKLDILRDPDAIAVNEWLQQHNLTIEQLILTERRYHSLSSKILLVRAQQLLVHYPEIKMTWQKEILSLSGVLDQLQKIGRAHV